MKKYPYLPEDRQILYVSIENEFMKEAKQVALTESTDSVQPTGSVIVKNGVILGKAANRSPLGHYKLLSDFHKNVFCVRRLLRVKTGTKYWLCPGCAKYSDHSEQRAIKDAMKNLAAAKDSAKMLPVEAAEELSDVSLSGAGLSGADLYLWGHWWCCKPCWEKIITAGIKNVYLLDESEGKFRR